LTHNPSYSSLACLGEPLNIHSFPTRRSSDLGEMLEQFGEEHEPLPLAQALRQHVCRQHFLEDGHWREVLVTTWGAVWPRPDERRDRKSTRLNSSHVSSSYAVFCLKTKIRSKA